MTDGDIARIPAGNLAVSREAFGRLWREVEACAEAEAETGMGTSTAQTAGMVLTCRWLARATMEVNGRRFLAVRPVGRGSPLAYPELIEAEYVAAESAMERGPRGRPSHVMPGYLESVCAVLRWAWRRNGPRPGLPETAPGAAV